MADQNTETFAFQAEINQLMQLIINNFYSEPSLFLRELISNGSDALDKIHYLSFEDKDAMRDTDALEIKIIPDIENNTLTIWDTGIGMTKAHLIENLGTIASSGTKNFINTLQENKDVDMSLIGQFGVGFYSAYLVANEVEVHTKHPDDEQMIWKSSAGGHFTITSCEENDIPRGTKVILHLKEEHAKFLKAEELEKLVKKHSGFIPYPIYIYKEKEVEVPVEEEEPVEEEGPKVEVLDDEEEEKKEEKPKTEKKTIKDFERVNTQDAIWARDAADVTEEEYNEFFKTLGPHYEDPMAYKLVNVDGDFSYKALLYIPPRAPSDIFNRNAEMNNIKLYVRRVFITDESKKLCPEWLAFLSGVVDSPDLPLNVSREMLQRNKILELIKSNLTKRAIDMFKNLAKDEEKYKKFYEEFSRYIKLGITDDAKNRKKLSKLLRYHTSKSGDERCSLQDYVDRMKDGQTKIYYITGESKDAVATSPFVERLTKLDFEVIYMTEPIDEFLVQNLNKFGDHDLVCITKENLELELADDEKEKIEQQKKDFEKTCEKMKEALGEKVSKVVVGTRIEESPCCLVTPEMGWTANLSRIMKDQPLQGNNPFAMFSSQKIMEINPNHTIVQTLKKKVDDEDETGLKDLSDLLYQTSLLTSGFSLDEPQQYGTKIFKMLQYAYEDVSIDQPVEVTESSTVEENIADLDTEDLELVD
eukprot:TRINITY_DN3093_c0_g1_i1.p1 TRINITY_DN3093_c0_g1~~TRINITY_DN3093_c0_g1_i1.p1  ORF type:complete len:711 (-),score=223.76 TRINITY_DN3093_c0_g1_i1:1678-3780(-)